MVKRPSYPFFRRHCALGAVAVTFVALLLSCSTTRVLTGQQKRLKSNKIVVANDRHFNTSDLIPYLKQPSKGWSPFLCVYNWENGEGKGWDKFVHKLGTAPVIYDSSLVASSVSNLKTHLDYLGYYNSDVEARVIDKKRKNVQVRYDITLGRRYPVSELTFDIPEGDEFAYDFYSDTTNCIINAGDYLSEELLNLESTRGAASLRNMGYYDFSKNFYRFQADTVTDPGNAKLKLIIDRHPRGQNENMDRIQHKYTIGKVVVSYGDDMKVRPSMLSGLNTLTTGSTYSDEAVNRAYSRFSSIGMFRSVNVRTTPRENENVVDCDIDLQKGQTRGFKVGLEASINFTTLLGISPSLSYYNKNLFHGGEIFNLSVSSTHQLMFKNSSVRSNEVGVSASLNLPSFVPLPNSYFHGSNIPRTELKLSFNHQDRPEYIRNQFSASFGYNGNLKRNFYYQLSPISIKYVRMPRIDSLFLKQLEVNPFIKNSYQDHLDAGLTSLLYYSSSRESNPTETYWYSRLLLDLSGNLLSAFRTLMPEKADGTRLLLGVPFAQYVRAEVTLGRTFVWGKNSNHSLALRVMTGIGIPYGNSSALPFEKLFYAGGANSLRGWVARTVGPGRQHLQTTWVIPNQSGNFRFEANAEYRFKIVWKLAGAVFADAGNIWNIGRDADDLSRLSWDNLPQSIAFSWGYGLRVDLGFIILRLDNGLRVHDPSLTSDGGWISPSKWYQNGYYAIHFGVGYPF